MTWRKKIAAILGDTWDELEAEAGDSDSSWDLPAEWLP
jgi:hypothetical protein